MYASIPEETPLLIPPKKLAALLSVSLRHLWRMRDAGTLPAPLRLGSSRVVRWTRASILEYLSQQNTSPR